MAGSDEPLSAAALRAAVDEARARWPGVAFATEGLAGHLGRLGRGWPGFPVDACLAAACAAGDAAALRALDAEFLSRVPDVVRRVDGASAFAAEIGQELRVRLLVRGEGGQ